MIRECYEKICAGEERRANLILLKKILKEEKNRNILRSVAKGPLNGIMKCLADGDAKVRKNAAAVLGLMREQEALDVLMDAYREEEQLFVRPEYVDAVAQLDCTEYLPELRERLEALTSREILENEKKHIRAETAALRELLLARGNIKRHIFNGRGRAHEVIFVTLPAFQKTVAEKLPGKKMLVASGVRALVSDIEEAMTIRPFLELLFVLTGGKTAAAEPKEIAGMLAETDLMRILEDNHDGRAPFYFRIGVAGPGMLGTQGTLAKETAAAVEEAFGGRLLNSVSHYEIEIRLFVGSAGEITPYLKLYTLSDPRFCYRKYHVAAGMKPYLAAGLMALAGPYLKEHAQVLDPFCGVGTLLMERQYALPVRSSYGVDLFGEAIDKARANSRIAGMPIHYIHRDFFDFTHTYLFDEIVTDLPDIQGGNGEKDAFYGSFLRRADQLLVEKGRIICYCGEMDLLKKHMRLQNRFRLLQQFEIRRKNGMYLFILEKKRKAEENG